MMSALHLTTGRVNVGLLRDDSRRKLVEYLSNLDGSKTIIWDPELMGPFNLIGDSPFLRQYGVNQMLQVQGGKLQQTAADHVIYIIRPAHSIINKVTDNIKKEERSKETKRKFHLLFMPRGSLICERRLADLGILGDIASVIELPVLYPLDNDLVSLELGSSFYECYVEQDYSSLFNVAAAIMKMQVLFGFIPKVEGLGKSARQVADVIQRMRLDLGGGSGSKTHKVQQRFDSILLLDRSVDLITPLVTQRTYEGLIDELFGIKHNSVKLPSDKFNNGDSPTEQVSPKLGEIKSFPLSSAEELFAELRDKNFKDVGPYLSQKSKVLSNVKMETNQAKSVQELKQIVDKLPRFQVMKKSLSDHLAIGEMIKQNTETESFLERVETEWDFLNTIDTDQKHPVIEDLVSKSENIDQVLRLICLQSQTNSGMKKYILEFYKREIIQTYGYEHVISLHNLEKVGLLKTSASSSILQTSNLKPYNIIRKTLRLTNDRSKQEHVSTDIHHVYNGYAPISVRLAEFLIHPGWRAITEIFKYLPEPCFEEDQNMHPHVGRRSSTVYSDSQEPRTILIVFLGGVTFAEVSALRFLSKKKPLNVNFVILTTKIINGNTFIKSLCERLKMSTIY